jgi:hypothetical protein
MGARFGRKTSAHHSFTRNPLRLALGMTNTDTHVFPPADIDDSSAISRRISFAVQREE